MFRPTKIGAAVLALGASLAAPEYAAAQSQQLERVEVTGSSIRRLDAETALPVTVITRADIEKSGAASVEELMHKVSAGGAMFSDTTQGAGYATSNVNLRGLGANSTLVLLNGRRMANHPFGSIGGNVAVDLNSIPFAAIDRIEVLRDGASAVYGSDAVGGVVNFITRRDFTGGNLSVRYGEPQKSIGGKEQGASFAFGHGDLTKDNYNLLVTGNLQKNTRIRAVDQGWYNRGAAEIDGAPPPTSGRSYPGRLVDIGISPGAYVNDGTTKDPNLDQCDPVNTVIQAPAGAKTPGGQQVKRCRFIYAAVLDNLPDQEKGDVYARLTVNLSKDHQAYVDASYARNHNIGRVAPVPIDSTAGHLNVQTAEYPAFQMPINSKYFPTALLATLGYKPADYDPDGNGFTEIAMRALPVGNRINDNTNSQGRLVAGLKGVLEGWDYDTALTYAKSNGDLSYFGYVNEPKFLAALRSGKINPFGPMDADGLAALNSTLMTGPMRKSSSTTTSVDGKASKELSQMDGGMMAVALGFDLRQEKADDRPVNDDYSKGLHIGGEGTVPVTTASRRVGALFAELNLPFAKGWEGTLAARYDHYSDFGSTFNPRASLRFQPSKEVMVRASAGTGFRAPSLWDVHAPSAFTNTANSALDPECPAQFTDDDRCNTQFNVLNASSPNLKPEKSKQFSLGIVLEPVKWLSTSIDYWNITKKDAIGQVTGDAILSDSALYAKYKSRVHRAANGLISYIDTPIENLGGLKTSGIDFSAKASWQLPDIGKVVFATDGTYITVYKDQSGKDQPYISYVGTAGDGGRVQPVPRFQNTLSVELQRATWSLRLENQFIQGWTEAALLVSNSLGCDCKAYHVKDSSRWNLSGSYSGFKNLTLRAGIRNLLDTDPPFTAVPSNGSHASGYAASFTDPRGRFFYGSASYAFK